MSFKPNPSQQLTMDDSALHLTERERKILEKSWAKPFAEYIFPAIDEKPFEVLYSDVERSRPNTPVNICIGALILQGYFNYSDDEMVEALACDVRFQYALHTTSFAEQPLSDKTLSRFRHRCYDYKEETGKDLLGDCVKSLAARIRKYMGISGKFQRMDSMMINANIRKLTRGELLYVCIQRTLKECTEQYGKAIPSGFERYTDANDYNRTFYYANPDESENILQRLLADGTRLLAEYGDVGGQSAEYAKLARAFKEQTVEEDGKPRLRTKEDGGMHSDMLQSPTDPDATYREKNGKSYQGYVLNLTEEVGEGASVVTDFQFEPNTYSDSQFLKDHVSQTETQEEGTVLVTDGAYCGLHNTELCAEKNISLVTTSLTGRPTEDIMADFEFSEDGQNVLRCPAGNRPKACTYNGTTGQCKISFAKGCCMRCPHRDMCEPKIRGKMAQLKISKAASERAKSVRQRKTEENRNLARFRNGVETLPSVLRRIYGCDDRLPRGKTRASFFMACKIGALNFGKFLTKLRGSGRYAQNPVFAEKI